MDLKKIMEAGLQAIESADVLETLNDVRIEFLSKKGALTKAMGQMKDLSNEEKPLFGKRVNEVKEALETALKAKVATLEALKLKEDMQRDAIDVTLPGTKFVMGAQNPLVLIQREIETFFQEMGYKVVEGDEVELDLYNFERANIPHDHPAREMQDTFYIDEHTLLRTHTTAIQTRALEAYAPSVPVKVICPGKVYRRDDDDATHSHQFVQVEGLVVGHGITLADLKGTLSLFAKRMFGETRVIRFRPSYFQFTEPSVEVDVSCHICDGKGCNVCKHTGWIEILGAGMVHPQVLRDAGYEDPKLTGFAFGAGAERIAMLKYGIEDIRSFYINDKRFIEQFKRYE
ncbi:phenylalanine--tRNA ligase subunit alpha [Erysipelothrix sp. HDW6C]|uniref:phenylalanine--tRNA ligase subunit alpha n=1 Tax=Erysipelothrix sp. HDW6C TaxID=2714930 RepID=UPI00140BAA0E|nr:phenylalanine--tRNA ligase subunit alpha [Erysipelothrix sp. HDW6C]QIK70140.1 phenylalanine--tRNA ligase subunit alpha [Erysipelothrix sp. HDW6C]